MISMQPVTASDGEHWVWTALETRNTERRSTVDHELCSGYAGLREPPPAGISESSDS